MGSHQDLIGVKPQNKQAKQPSKQTNKKNNTNKQTNKQTTLAHAHPNTHCTQNTQVAAHALTHANTQAYTGTHCVGVSTGMAQRLRAILCTLVLPLPVAHEPWGLVLVHRQWGGAHPVQATGPGPPPPQTPDPWSITARHSPSVVPTQLVHHKTLFVVLWLKKIVMRLFLGCPQKNPKLTNSQNDNSTSKWQLGCTTLNECLITYPPSPSCNVVCCRMNSVLKELLGQKQRTQVSDTPKP